MDKLKLMQTYTEVVRTGSFSDAADALSVSRPVVTKHIAELEHVLGLRLLHRTTRKLSITEAGLEYFEFCTQILKDIKEKESCLHSLQLEPRGSLTIGAPQGFASLYAGTALAAFVRRYPQIVPTIYIDPDPNRLNLVEHGYDLALSLTSPGDGVYIGMGRIFRFRRILCAAPAFLEKHGTPRDPTELSGYNCLLNVRTGGGTVWGLSSRRGRKNIRVTGKIKSNSVIVLRDAAVAGAGISLLPTYCIAEDLREGRLAHILPEYSVPDGELSVRYPEANPPKKVLLFVEFLIEHLHSLEFLSLNPPTPLARDTRLLASCEILESRSE